MARGNNLAPWPREFPEYSHTASLQVIWRQTFGEPRLPTTFYARFYSMIPKRCPAMQLVIIHLADPSDFPELGEVRKMTRSEQL